MTAMRFQGFTLGLAIAAATAACTQSQPAAAESAEALQPPAASVQVAAEGAQAEVAVQAVDHEGKPVGEPRVLQLAPEAGDPKELGLTPVPAGAN
jgi:hypothetical protein